MYYYAAVYKYIKNGAKSGYHIFSHESKVTVSKPEINDLIAELLTRKAKEFDSIEVIWLDSIEKNAFKNLELFDAEVISNILSIAKQVNYQEG